MEAVILAAGKSKRMKSRLSKIFHNICGRPIIFYVVKALENFKVHIVSNPDMKEALEKMFPEAVVHVQKEQKGTADALSKAINHIESEAFAVVNGDMPLIKGEDIETGFNILKLKGLDCLIFTSILDNPYGYGRIVRENGKIMIVEEREATEHIKQIKEVNSGIYIFKTESALRALPKIEMSSETGEYYLTDIIKYMDKIDTLEVNRENMLGVNTRKQLSEVRRIMQRRIIDRFEYVTFIDPENTYINYDVEIGEDTVIYPNVHLKDKTKIGRECIIENGSVIENSVIRDNVHIKPYCVIEESIISNNCQVGPFAHLRPMSELEDSVRVGNFVETKKAKLGRGTKASHLTYLGDAVLGEDVNVGCGTITCNYDGYQKNETIIEDRVFIGSDVQLVAPVKVGNDALIAAGTTVTKDVEPFALAISRVPQVNKPNWVKKYREAMEKKLKEKNKT